VSVGGAPGIWLFGRRHAVVFVGADGREYRTVGALAGHTLVWQHGGIAYRLEAELSLPEALELAESLRDE
jgi:phage gp45-like